MDCPEAYTQHNLLQRKDNILILNEYSHLIKWRKNAKVLDLGSGDGTTTMEVLEPRLPRDYERLVGLDVEEKMVRYANKCNTNPKVGFQRFDIAGDEVLNEKFDHVFSFFMFHWVEDMRKGFRNLSTLMKPGGDLLMNVVTDCPFFTYIGRMLRHPKWGKYLKDGRVLPFQVWKGSEEIIKHNLELTGFENIQIFMENKEFYYENWSDCLKCLLATDPIINKLTMDQKLDYIIDFHNELRDIFSNFQTLTGKVMMPYNILIIHATKRL